MRFLAVMLAGGILLTATAADVTKGGFGAAREGADGSEKTERKTEASPKRTTYPFYGTLDSVNENEKTVTLRGKKKNRVILFTNETRIQKNSSRASVKDGVPGERVSGSVRKNAEGKEEALTIRFGAKPGGK